MFGIYPSYGEEASEMVQKIVIQKLSVDLTLNEIWKLVHQGQVMLCFHRKIAVILPFVLKVFIDFLSYRFFDWFFIEIF